MTDPLPTANVQALASAFAKLMADHEPLRRFADRWEELKGLALGDATPEELSEFEQLVLDGPTFKVQVAAFLADLDALRFAAGVSR